MGYFSYYLVWLFLTYLVQYPPLLIGLVVLFIAQRFLPDPVVFLRSLGRIRALKRQIGANPANVTARRDMALVYLDRMQPRAALRMVDEARQRFPADAELLYLRGLAHCRLGDYENALPSLVDAVERDGRLRFGAPYLLAGDALRKLGRPEEALDAYERFLSINSSSVEGHVKLALAHRQHRDIPAAKAALGEAFDTFSQVPGFHKRRELGWWIRAWFYWLLV